MLNPPESEESLIVRILDWPPNERAEFLRRTYVENPGLRDRLKQIAQAISSLESESKAAPLPNSDAERARVMELAFAPQELTGTMIGPYKLLEEIGEGGFGVVWMAEQTEPIRRRVALKVIKSGMDSREVTARFEAERQALALMDHPGIARVFDAGTTDSGRPYFVMELVRGVPITKYCDELRVTADARLRLFIAVCRAVQHAHQKGIIHRDLKPSNIIVSRHDGVAIPKIIDFGIAKATEAPLTEKTLFTRFHSFIGTPAYTSPEQMDMSGLDVDTRSDIYSLGVLLYELLTGRPPFDPGQLLRSSLEEMRRTIREVDPATPSQCVRTLPSDVRATVAAQRSTDHATHTVLLRGDLDWIVMRCLEKDRTRRYETASALAADVQRHLDHEPVVARPASTTYRIRKFVRRHRLGVTAGAAIIISLVVGLVVASVALVREHAALERESLLRVEADANAAKAQTEAARSAQVAHFMKDMLSGVGPSAALGRDTAMLREILESTARRLETELGEQPEVAADLRETLALVYRDMGRFAEAESLLQIVVASNRELHGGNSEVLANSLNNHGSVLRRLGRNEEAEPELQEALAIRRKLFGDEHPAVADTMFELSQVFVRARSLEDSKQLLNRALEIRRKIFGPEHVSIAETLEALGTNARYQFGHEEVIALHSQALAMYRRVLGSEHPAVARSLDSLGYSLRHITWGDEADEPYKEAFFIRRKILGAEHPDLVVALLRYVGGIPARTADEATIHLVGDFIAEQRAVLPAGSPLLAPALLMLANLIDLPGRNPTQAAELVREAQGLIDHAISSGVLLDPEIVDAMTLFGWWKFLDGDSAEARLMCEAGLRLVRAAPGNSARALIQPSHILSWVYYGSGQFEEAIRQFNETNRAIREGGSPSIPFVGMSYGGLGAAYRKLGRTQEGRQILEAALESWKWGRDPSVRFPRSIPAALGELGFSLNHEGKFAEAEPILREALQGFDAKVLTLVALRINPRGQAESGLGTALAGQGRFEEAEPLLTHAYEELKAGEPLFAGERGAILREALEAVIAFYEARGMPEKVAEWTAKRP